MAPENLSHVVTALRGGRPAEALAGLEPWLARPIADPQVLELAAIACFQLGRYWRALEFLQRIDGASAARTSVLVNKAVAHLHLGDAAGAFAVLGASAGEGTDTPEAFAVRAGALIELGRHHEALASAERGLALTPKALDLAVNKSTALLQLERGREALATCDAALVFHPGHPLLQANRALALASLGHRREAMRTALQCGNQAVLEGVLDSIIAKYPSTPTETSSDGSVAVGEMMTLIEEVVTQDTARSLVIETLVERLLVTAHSHWAVHACERIDADPSDSTLLVLAARARAAAGDVEGAEDILRRLYATTNDIAQRFTGGLFGREPSVDARTLYMEASLLPLMACDWAGYQDRIDEARAIVEKTLAEGRPAPIDPAFSLLMPWPASLQQRIAISHAREYAALAGPLPKRGTLQPHDRIHVGYLSADLRDHPTGHLVRRLFGLHDRKRFRVTVYALRPGDDSPYHRRIVGDADAYVDLSGVDAAGVAERIGDDQVHILIDLMGYTEHGKPGALARRAAPLQINFLGMPGTTGAPYIDYIIADPVVIPPDRHWLYSEAPLLLPFSCQVADDDPPLDATPITRADEGLPEDAFVYCSFNAERKITPDLLDTWAQILTTVPRSVLWLLRPKTEPAQALLRQQLEARGVSPQRVILAPRTLRSRHLRRIALADLFLDAFVYSAATTAIDSLLAGLPLLTLQGQTFQSRVGASLLLDAGLPELITHTPAAYAALAIGIANDPERLARWRQQLTAARAQGDLLSTARFVRHLEHGLEIVWHRHLAGEPVRSIEVPLSQNTARELQ